MYDMVSRSGHETIDFLGLGKGLKYAVGLWGLLVQRYLRPLPLLRPKYDIGTTFEHAQRLNALFRLREDS